jgi:hypothetical protein
LSIQLHNAANEFVVHDLLSKASVVVAHLDISGVFRLVGAPASTSFLRVAVLCFLSENDSEVSSFVDQGSFNEVKSSINFVKVFKLILVEQFVKEEGQEYVFISLLEHKGLLVLPCDVFVKCFKLILLCLLIHRLL